MAYIGKEKLPQYDFEDQGQFGTCHSSDTEVLTEYGWKLFSELNETDLVASVNPETSELIFVKPVNHIKYHYKGKMIHFNHISLDALVTPDHKMLVRKWDESKRTLSDKYTLVEAKNIGWYCGLMTSVNWNGVEEEYYTLHTGRKIPMDAWLEFLGLYIAEGTLVPQCDWKIQIAAFKNREKNFAKSCFDRLGFHATEQTDRFMIYKKEICQELINLGFQGIKAPQKKIPEFVFKLSSRLIAFFIAGYFAGDGHMRNKTRAFTTTSRELANGIQILLLLTGKWSGLYEREPRESEINGRKIKGNYKELDIYEWSTNNLSIERKKNVSELEYDDYVYCLEVEPYHTLVTRRNNKILISGNCEGNGIAHMLDYEALESFPDQRIKFSPLWIYYWSKVMEGNWDEGTDPELGFKQIMEKGVCLEEDYPYSLLADVHNIPVPSQQAVQNALKYKIKGFTKLDNTTEAIDKAIDAGKVVNVGTIVTDNFVNTPDGGYIGIAEGSLLGGHDYCIIGRNDELTYKISDTETDTGFYLLVNSWNRQQYAWVSKAFIGERLEVTEPNQVPILQGAWIVDTGWVNDKPNNPPTPNPVNPTPAPPSPQPTPQPQSQYKEKIEMKIGDKKVIVNGFEHLFDVAPVLDQASGRTLVELRFLSEVNGWNVVWDEKTQSIQLLR